MSTVRNIIGTNGPILAFKGFLTLKVNGDQSQVLVCTAVSYHAPSDHAREPQGCTDWGKYEAEVRCKVLE